VLLATALTLGTTYHLSEKAKHGIEKGIAGVEHVASRGKEKLFGKEKVFNAYPDVQYWGRHEALQKLRDALGVESGKEMDAEDYERLEELLRLDRYSHSPGFWKNLKDKVGQETHDAAKKTHDVAKKIKSATGMDHHEKEKRFRNTLGLDSEPGFGHTTIAKLKEILGVEEDKPFGQETLEKLKDLLKGEKEKEPTLWEKTKEKAKATLHIGKEKEEASLLEKVKEKAEKVKEKMEQVKDKVLGEDSEELIKEAKAHIAETEEILDKASDSRKKEKQRGRR